MLSSHNKILFSHFKDEYVKPIKSLLDQYNIQYIYEPDDCSEKLGYYIENGVVKIISALNAFKLGHELAHIILINNFEKLLTDNWAMPIMGYNRSYLTGRKFLLTECRVWGTENFLYKTENKRNPNEHFIYTAIRCDESEDNHFYEVREKVINTMSRHENNMTLEKFLYELEIRFKFIQNHINNNPNFNSRFFNLYACFENKNA